MPRDILSAPTKLSDRDISRQLDVHKATICRWRIKGVPLPDGSRLRLPYTRAGKRAYVHPDDLREFLAAMTNADQQRHQQPGHTSADVWRSHPPRGRARRAEQEADEMGI